MRKEHIIGWLQVARPPIGARKQETEEFKKAINEACEILAGIIENNDSSVGILWDNDPEWEE